MRKPRILFFSEAVSLAHISRPAVLARALWKAGYRDLLFACAAPSALPLVGAPFEVHPLHSISSQEFFERIEAGRRPYEQATIDSYCEADRALIQSFKPDLVVSDFRLSLSISAALERVPQATITNAYWSPYSTRRSCAAPDMQPMRLFGQRTVEYVFRAFFPWFDAFYGAPFDKVRSRQGLSTLGSFRSAVTTGDYVWYADAPQIVRTRDLPRGHSYLGPIHWTPQRDGKTVQDPKEQEPLIYASPGSSGQDELLDRIVEGLSLLGLPALVATAGKKLRAKAGPLVKCVPYVNADELGRSVRVAITNGGSPSTYQWLARAVPVLALPSNSDQMLMVEHLSGEPAVRSIRASSAAPSAIAEVMRELLGSTKAQESAQKLSGYCGELRAESEVVRRLREIFP